MENIEKIAVHESQSSDKVEQFIEFSSFKSGFQKYYNNGNVAGVYLNDDGKVVATDIYGETIENILRNS
jgi:hypothetical protein